MAIVTIWNGSTPQQVQTTPGTLLEAVLQASGCGFAMPCGGHGTCGKCRVQTAGTLSPIGSQEAALLSQTDMQNGIRLACMAQVTDDCSVWVNRQQIATLSWAKMPPLQPDGDGIGVAVDIGTTTVAVRLYDRATGHVLAESLEGNRQATFGADVISRIGYAKAGAAAELSRTIHTQLSEMTHSCMAQCGVSQLSAAVITGNTTMLHFYEEQDASGIAQAPFTPASLFGLQSQFPLAMADHTYLPPCIGSYVGADITCAILSSGMLQNPHQTTLLADIGTNGELALLKDGHIYCCSTAAGPAFEGAGLHQGMRASVGAVTAVSLDAENNVQVVVLGEGEALGLCGSGALDAIGVMLQLGILSGSGAITAEYVGQGHIVSCDGQLAWQLPGTQVHITQKDVRQIQLAKSAIYAGIYTLLRETNTQTDEIAHFYIAGGFGHSMNMERAAQIGLIPPALKDRVEIIGNGALAGAAMLLLQSDQTAQIEQIQRMATELNLSSNPVFSDLYIDGMIFEEDE